MVIEQSERYAAEGGSEGKNLGEDVDAVLLLIDHAGNATSLTLNPLHARQVAILVRHIACNGSGIP
ncbi:hypothetical protein H4V95_002262 [Arthrobacter sp. CAN_C5]|nr:hypothetical protein [Arthrobacter sp. CAN_C5]